MRNKLSQEVIFNQFLIKKLSKGFQQRLHLIMLREKAKIQKLRKEWKIPIEKGFVKKDDWDYWWRNLKSLVPEKVKNISYTEVEIYHIFHKFTELKTVKSTDTELYKRVITIKDNPWAVFDFEIKEFIRYLKLDQELHKIIWDYVLFNNGFIESIENTGIIVSERITYDKDKKLLEQKLSLIFGPNTDDKDLSAMYFFHVDKLQKNTPGYFKKKVLPIKRFSRCEKITNLITEGKTDWQIKDILLEEYIDLTIDQIRKIIKRIKAY